MKQTFLPLQRRNGRAVECGGLENRCTERYRGFESLFLRSNHQKGSEYSEPFFV
jgi:hypothetical protein